MSIYDDPELTPEALEFNNITFTKVGDRVRGAILRMEKIKTTYGMVAKYWLMDLDANVERTMLAGAIDLWTQLSKLRPEIGDILEIEMTRMEGRRYIFSVEVSHDESF